MKKEIDEETEKAIMQLPNQETKQEPESGANDKPSTHLEGGWGWVVVIGSALAHFLVVGFPRSFGVFYEELLIRFERPASETALVIALSNTIRQVFGKKNSTESIFPL